MPILCGAATPAVSQRCGSNWAHEVDRHAECSHHLQLFHAAQKGGREMQAVSSVVESQILTRLTYHKYYNFDIYNFAKLQCNQAGFSLPSLAAKHGVWRKRQALSTSSTGQPGAEPGWPDFILTIQSF
jgi:hypothetical protein